MDVAVDNRLDSPTYGKYVAVKLSADNKQQLFIPRGFLHGFSVLSEVAVFFYKCDNFYNKESEQGVIFNDVDLNINWQIPIEKQRVAEKDLLLANFKDLIFSV